MDYCSMKKKIGAIGIELVAKLELFKGFNERFCQFSLVFTLS
jgi:hypothetical protein